MSIFDRNFPLPLSLSSSATISHLSAVIGFFERTKSKTWNVAVNQKTKYEYTHTHAQHGWMAAEWRLANVCVRRISNVYVLKWFQTKNILKESAQNRSRFLSVTHMVPFDIFLLHSAHTNTPNNIRYPLAKETKNNKRGRLRWKENDKIEIFRVRFLYHTYTYAWARTQRFVSESEKKIIIIISKTS